MAANRDNLEPVKKKLQKNNLEDLYSIKVLWKESILCLWELWHSQCGVYNRVLQLLQTQSKSFLWLTINTYALFFKIPWNCLSLQQTTPFKIAKKNLNILKAYILFITHIWFTLIVN